MGASPWIKQEWFLNDISTTLNNHASVKIKPKNDATLIDKHWMNHATRKSAKTKDKQFYRENDQCKKETSFGCSKEYSDDNKRLTDS